MVVILESVIFVGLPDAKIDFQAQEEEVFSRRQLKLLPTGYNLPAVMYCELLTSCQWVSRMRASKSKNNQFF